MMSIFECEVFLKIWVRHNYFESMHIMYVGSKPLKLSGKLKNVSNNWFDKVENVPVIQAFLTSFSHCRILKMPKN